MSIKTDAVLSDIKTTDGKFYVGMTQEEAKEQGRSIFKEFIKIDNDERDGILSYDEIMNYRNKKIKKKRNGAFAFGGVALYQVIDGLRAEKNLDINLLRKIYTGAPEEIFSNNALPIRLAELAVTCVLVGVMAVKLFKVKKAEKQNEEYRQLYCQYMENQQKDKVA
ncbi:MAG: hypothetical protein MJ231_01480 [bacterium]|nr:hypothetical protein [bacterium]